VGQGGPGGQHQARVRLIHARRAQQPDRLFLPEKDSWRGMEQIRKLGYIDGHNIVLERRFAAGHAEQIKDFVADLVHRKVDVIRQTHRDTQADDIAVVEVALLLSRENPTYRRGSPWASDVERDARSLGGRAFDCGNGA